ncbi:GATA zinc finger domain-containing protein 14 [Anthonomus grandis grandis]|uniref:GATA zinc finger domain-containing protein 14 n=1 Tax=Anthonomus grandis grandis TaxID=2921223 RepID=UPI0021652FCA|nr:GATA zinc finger domain-containing protein 14 [Anthonomus grandis grandis]
MQGVSALLFLGILALWSSTSAVFLNHRPFPTYNLENMPDTQFSCRDKILGGYYADPDAQCQMFHVCVKVAGLGVQDFRFLCPNGTAFDQDHQICAEWEDVDCDATTLYYSSDNFDLYRVGSGFESKAVKYGEDEETFALQRAETGDARINREQQTQVVNQNKDYQRPQTRRNNNFNNNNNNNRDQERDIFRASSSSNFFNNRNNGKENDEDYDDNVNINQNRDYEQKRKIVRKQQKRPVQQTAAPVQQTPAPIQQQVQTRRPARPTGFVNNFAGSSYNPTTQRPASPAANSDQYSTPSSVTNNFRRGQRQRINTNQNNIVSSTISYPNPTPSYTISTPAPFRQSPPASKPFSQNVPSSTENYPTAKPTNAAVNYNTNYDVPKISNTQTENYPSNNPQYAKPTTAFASSQYNTAFDKKPTSPKKIDTYKPTTFSPSAKPFSISSNSFPTTFAPRTQQGFTQIAQQTNSFNSPKNPFSQQFNSPSTTQRSTTITQYTPTVPKISSTTPVGRSNRFDETQYDDGSYDPKYDYNGGGEDEFLKTAHSQNIASSRNELVKAQKKQQQVTTTQKPFSTASYTSRATENYPKSTLQSASRGSTPQVTHRPVENVPKEVPVKQSNKKVKNVSYDYAYYDSFGSEPDYDIDTEIKKSKV